MQKTDITYDDNGINFDNFARMKNDDGDSHSSLIKKYCSEIIEIYAHYKIAMDDIVNMINENHIDYSNVINDCNMINENTEHTIDAENILLEIVKAQYPLYEMMSDVHSAHRAHSLGIEFPNNNWPDFWEIISTFFCPTIDISHKNRKKKMEEKKQKIITDAEKAEKEGRTRLAKNIRSRTVRPQNWKKTIKTLQIGSCATDFTFALNHFLRANSKKLGFDGLEWLWASLCTREELIIDVASIRRRQSDYYNALSGRNGKSRRESTVRQATGLFSEGADYLTRYDNEYISGAVKYSGPYVEYLYAHASPCANDNINNINGEGCTQYGGASAYILKKEVNTGSGSFIIPRGASNRENPFKSIELVREVLSDAKVMLDGESSANIPQTVFVACDNAGEIEVATWVLSALVGLRKHGNIIARLSFTITDVMFSTLFVLSCAFSECTLATPSTGGSMYVVALDYKKNISAGFCKRIIKYVEAINANASADAYALFSPANKEEEDKFREFSAKIIPAFEKNIYQEIACLRDISNCMDKIKIKLFMDECKNISEITKNISEITKNISEEFFQERRKKFLKKWKNKFSPMMLDHVDKIISQ